jgi:hypothetical protein
VLLLSAVLSCVSPRRKGPEPEPVVNLLSNGSFEIDGQPSMEGWWPRNPPRVFIVSQPSPDGGRFSLLLHQEGHDPFVYVVANVTEVCPVGIYRLSVSGKAPIHWGGGSAFIEVSPSSRRPTPDSTVLTFLDSMWTRSVDTFFVTPGVDDSVWVVLATTGFPPGPGYIEALFDDIILEELD